jgi:hypothetical protein
MRQKTILLYNIFCSLSFPMKIAIFKEIHKKYIIVLNYNLLIWKWLRSNKCSKVRDAMIFAEYFFWWYCVELRALSLVGRCSTIWAHPYPFLLYILQIRSHAFFWAKLWTLNHLPMLITGFTDVNHHWQTSLLRWNLTNFFAQTRLELWYSWSLPPK